MAILAPRLTTRRKHVINVRIKEPKRYVNPLTGSLVQKATYLRALREVDRRDDASQVTLRKVDNMSRFMDLKVAKDIGNTTNLPKIDWSLLEARHYELVFLHKQKIMFIKGSSFVKLFKRRMRPVRDNWESVTVSIDSTIRDDITPLTHKEKDVTMGPFDDKMPPGLSRRDQYQFLMYTLFKDDRFNPQSGEHIVSVGGVTTKLKKVKLEDVRMGATRLISALVDKCNKNKRRKQNKGTCVQDCIYEACKGEDGFKRYTKSSLMEEINKFVFDNKGKRPSTREIINWRDNCHTNVSIYAVDPFYNTFVSSPAPRNNGQTVRLCFICKGGHCYPILNQNAITKITTGSSPIKHLDLIQWNTQHSEDKVERCKTIEDYHKIINQPKNILDSSLLFYQMGSMVKTR